MVLVSHFFLHKEDWGSPTINHWLNQLIPLCSRGVDIFFVLSGYLIGGILLRHRASPTYFKTFYLRRAFRILPAYWLLLLSFALIVPVDRHFRFGLLVYLQDPIQHHLASYFLFIQNIVMAVTRIVDPWWLFVTWSLAIEEQFYLVIPWIIRGFSLRATVWVCLVGLVGCPLLRWAYVVADNHVAAERLLVCRFDALAAGVLIALLVQREPWFQRVTAYRGWLAGALVALGAAMLADFCLTKPVLIQEVFAPTVWALGAAFTLLHLKTAPGGLLAAGLRSRALGYLGDISYFVYLFHLPFQATALVLVHHWTTRWDGWSLVAGLAAVIGAAAASRHLVELPLVKYAQRAFRYEPPEMAA